MNYDFISSLAETGKHSYQNLQELNDIYTNVFNNFAELNLAITKLGLNCSIEQAKLLAGASNYDSLLTAESEFANEYSNKFMEITNESSKLMLQSHDAFTVWFEKQFGEVKKEVEKQVKPKPASKKTTSTKKEEV